MSVSTAQMPLSALDELMWSEPALATTEPRNGQDAEWAAAAAVAAFLGLALAIVIYICSVCQARSFNACLNAVRDYWTRGC